mmetsp:Transcript_43025/g.115056  ORF Transcript_43025/g.115056 Transcript_43025/m.115056 type:complete len:94 (-) Transcript_43025:559-840(-)
MRRQPYSQHEGFTSRPVEYDPGQRMQDDRQRGALDEVFALQDELRAAKVEQQRLAGLLREYEAVAKRNADEVRAYREAMDRREVCSGLNLKTT